MLLHVCVVLLSLTILFWCLVRRYVLQSPLDNVPGPSPGSFLKGNMIQVHERHAWEFLNHLTNDYGQVVRLTGFFNVKYLWVFDPKALHHVVLKDQDVYEEAEHMLKSRHVAFGPGLMSATGERHRRQRKLLNPVFSIAHLRRITPIFYEVMHRLQGGIVKQLQASSQNEVDMVDWMGRAALELMGQGGLGYSFDSLVDNVQNPYANAIKEFPSAIVKCITWRLAMPLFTPLLDLQKRYPVIKKIVRKYFWLIPDKDLQHMKSIIDTMDEVSWKIYTDKKHALMTEDPEAKINVQEGRDIMSVLLRANLEAAEEDKLPEEEIIAQIMTLTSAGTDTTSSALARILQLMCEHQEVQDRVRAEIVSAQQANGNQDLEYNELVGLPYLDAVCRETLRLYPPSPFVSRDAHRDIMLPLSTAIQCVDGTYTNSILVPKGTKIFVGTYSANRNKAIWGPDAEEWKPERWMNGALPQTVLDAKIPGVYANLMTFLGGGRACIGFKFSQLEMKVALAILLSSFRFRSSEREKTKIFWNRASVAWPSVGPYGNKPSLPLVVEPISH